MQPRLGQHLLLAAVLLASAAPPASAEKVDLLCATVYTDLSQPPEVGMSCGLVAARVELGPDGPILNACVMVGDKPVCERIKVANPLLP